MEKSRDYFFDNAKFFLILLVVLGHSIEVAGGELLSALYQLIYLFHMPAFVLIAGYFSKNQSKQKFGELITQYLVFQTIYSAFSLYVLKNEGVINYTTPYWILWFSFSLIAWKAVAPYFTRLKYPVVTAVFFAVLAGYDGSIGYYLSLSRIIVYFPFFLLGYCSDKETFEKLKARIHPVFSAVLFAGFFVLLLFVPKFPIGLLYNSSSYQAMDLLGWYAGGFRLLFFACSTLLTFNFFALIPHTKKCYSQLGQRTLQAYLLHGFILRYLASREISTYLAAPLQKTLFFAAMILLTILLLTKPVSVLFRPISFLSRLVFPVKDK